MEDQKLEEKEWNKKKEELKQRFLHITNKYSMFEGGKQNDISEKLRLRFAKTKAELNKIINSL